MDHIEAAASFQLNQESEAASDNFDISILKQVMDTIDFCSPEILNTGAADTTIGTSDSHTAIGDRFRRNLRSRDNVNLHKTQRRTINKPKKYLPNADGLIDKSVETFYLNTKKFSSIKRHTNLETIFEEPQETGDGEVLFSRRKCKRLFDWPMTPTIKIPTSVRDKRRKRIKTVFDKVQKIKKISMAAFIEHLKELNSEADVVPPIGNLNE